jgi:hypothetical protein
VTVRGLLGGAWLTVWATGGTLVCASFLASHVLTLPVPVREDPRLDAGVARVAATSGHWKVLHALSSECKCSGQVLAHLLATERPVNADETVLLVGPPGDVGPRLQARGFGFESLTAEALDQRYGIPAVPLLVVADPSGAVRYSGGYTSRKQGPDIQDLQIFARLVADTSVDALPLFGCPVNTELRDEVAPFGIR